MFNKILIANRGEIALRVMRTCRKMGIKTVAVYSDADKESLPVRMADESYPLGGTRVSESYLNIEKMIRIAKKSGAEAIHPGYGLLSEHPELARACQEQGIRFIGPTPEVMAKMGSKIEARRAMAAAGVPVVPGSEVVADADAALSLGCRLGYPLMLKASAGGGGIGMQMVHDEEELVRAFERNRTRAQQFFGDGTMFLEKVVAEPRHIEIQVLADTHGHLIHLGERECSIQRRHQKVVEEAPSSLLSPESRAKMGEAALRAAQAIGYTNAGTVEFLVDEEQNFYFLEMNTRLQVEHPVTEEVTGIDLVEQQIRIAAGERLALNQPDVKMKGHAIEARIYAEDPDTFLPSPGRITQLVIPQGHHIRHELGVEAGSVVTPYYDPMIGKLIVKGETRAEAIMRMIEALQACTIQGIKTNLPLLLKVISHPQFKQGKITTQFIERYITRKER